jgi:hypothetical protein
MSLFLAQMNSGEVVGHDNGNLLIAVTAALITADASLAVVLSGVFALRNAAVQNEAATQPRAASRRP